MEAVTILSSLCTFLLAHKADIASKVIASASYDSLKGVIDFSDLKHGIKRFFIKEEDADKYVEALCNTEATNIKKPIRDLEDTYEEIAGQDFNDELYKEVKRWVESNENQLIATAGMQFKNEHGFNIGNQRAGKNIINIKGDYKPNKSD